MPYRAPGEQDEEEEEEDDSSSRQPGEGGREGRGVGIASE